LRGKRWRWKADGGRLLSGIRGRVMHRGKGRGRARPGLPTCLQAPPPLLPLPRLHPPSTSSDCGPAQPRLPAAPFTSRIPFRSRIKSPLRPGGPLQGATPEGLKNRRGPTQAHSLRPPSGGQQPQAPSRPPLPRPSGGSLSLFRPRASYSPGCRPRPSSRARVLQPRIHQRPTGPPRLLRVPPRGDRLGLPLLCFPVALNSLSSIGLFVRHLKRGGPSCRRRIGGGGGGGGCRWSPPR
jgi:hypothetical protein